MSEDFSDKIGTFVCYKVGKDGALRKYTIAMNHPQYGIMAFTGVLFYNGDKEDARDVFSGQLKYPDADGKEDELFGYVNLYKPKKSGTKYDLTLSVNFMVDEGVYERLAYGFVRIQNGVMICDLFPQEDEDEERPKSRAGKQRSVRDKVDKVLDNVCSNKNVKPAEVDYDDIPF